jgi:hypothetical protein
MASNVFAGKSINVHVAQNQCGDSFVTKRGKSFFELGVKRFVPNQSVRNGPLDEGDIVLHLVPPSLVGSVCRVDLHLGHSFDIKYTSIITMIYTNRKA